MVDEPDSSWFRTKVAQSLDECLQGQADQWYINELTDAIRAGIRTDINLFCKELETRFKDPPGIALSRLESLRYTV